jgi:hypothetical protein
MFNVWFVQEVWVQKPRVFSKHAAWLFGVKKKHIETADLAGLKSKGDAS